ncbi:Bax inhibitor-1/YccA family protein [Faucicola boevrei]|uniref:Bax inhibitor-1/YccA family protein n=1 Tax=Faucicola boevrei TaxID=346665 RepID=UPI00037EEF3F|nr:Bax inhibitor-1/YccA family protein [Moraxella boevrei]
MANPILSSVDMAVSTTPMTIQGVVRKTAFLLGISAFTGISFFMFAVLAGLSSGFIYGASLVSILVAFIMGFVVMSKPHLGKVLAVPYAIFEGILIGAISLFVTTQFPTVAVTAMVATFVTAGVMLALYRANVIKVTEKFRSVMMSAIIAISLVYLVQIGLSLFGNSIPYLFSGGATAVAFSLLVVVIASFSLLLDFDNVERAYQSGVDKSFEWVLSIGILSTLVWMYIEFVRLLRNLQD